MTADPRSNHSHETESNKDWATLHAPDSRDRTVPGMPKISYVGAVTSGGSDAISPLMFFFALVFVHLGSWWIAAAFTVASIAFLLLHISIDRPDVPPNEPQPGADS